MPKQPHDSQQNCFVEGYFNDRQDFTCLVADTILSYHGHHSEVITIALHYCKTSITGLILLLLWNSRCTRIPDIFCILAKAWRVQCVCHTSYSYSMSNFGEEGGEGAEEERASPNPSALHMDTVNEVFKYVAVETIKEGVFVCV